MKISAIFSDYDGTLSQLESRREDAVLSPILRRLLTKVSKSVTLGIITTKDLSFIRERVPFAHGISASCGLEMQVGEKTLLDERVREPHPQLENAYKEILKKVLQARDNLVIERKESEDEHLIGFCLDWRLARNWDEAKRIAAPLLDYSRKQGLYVIESDISPFANVFPMKIDKGEAYEKLKKELDVQGPIMYLGDSEADDPAFQLAEVSIGVKHRRIMPKLQCKYRVEFFELENLLTKLIDSDFDFKENMAAKNA
ncbi:MAG TPA: HAD-IIB family hydrolase [archaeon]|nr:HAD-IIB family hydrolase [archaeon]